MKEIIYEHKFYIKNDAEEIIKEAGLTPQQKANFKLRQVSKLVPVKEIRTQKEFEDFFDKQ